MLAIPNYARLNRDKDLTAEAGPQAAEPQNYMGSTAITPQQGPGQQGQRAPRPVASVVWIKQA